MNITTIGTLHTLMKDALPATVGSRLLANHRPTDVVGKTCIYVLGGNTQNTRVAGVLCRLC